MKKKINKNSIVLVLLGIILILVYGRIFFKRSSQKKGVDKSPVPVVKVEKKKVKEGVGKIEPLSESIGPQEWGRSPFVLPDESAIGLPGDEELALTGITWKGGQALALIGNRMVREGDTIGEKRVMKIKRDSVILKQGKKEHILMLKKGGQP